MTEDVAEPIAAKRCQTSRSKRSEISSPSLLRQAAPRSSQNSKRKHSEISSSPHQGTAGESMKLKLRKRYRHLPQGTKVRLRIAENKLREYLDVHEALSEDEKKMIPSVDEDGNLRKRLYNVCLDYNAVPNQESGAATTAVVSHQAGIEASSNDDDDKINTFVFSQLAISDPNLQIGHRSPLPPPAKLLNSCRQVTAPSSRYAHALEQAVELSRNPISGTHTS